MRAWDYLKHIVPKSIFWMIVFCFFPLTHVSWVNVLEAIIKKKKISYIFKTSVAVWLAQEWLIFYIGLVLQR